MSPTASDDDAALLVASRRWRRIAVWVSVALHVVLLIALGMWYVERRKADGRARAEAAAAESQRAEAERERLPSPEVRPAQVQATLAQAQEKFAEASTDQQLSELEKQAAKLESLSSEESVAEIANKFDEWIPTPQRASEPAAEPVAGEFDFDTAQIHEVLRTAADDGQWNYRSVLVDAEGRTFEVEIDRVQGEKTYATFESLKKFPLAEQVYRQIAMGLIDQSLQAERNKAASTTAAGDPPASDAPAEVDNRDPFDNSDSP